MAVIPKNEIILGGRSGLPEGIYGVEIKSAEVKVGQKENARPTLRIEAEIIAPLSIEVAGETHKVAGRKVFFMPCLVDPSLDYGLGVIIKGLQVSGFPFEKFGADGDVDDEKFHVLAGHKMQMHLSSYEDVLTRAATQAELRADPSKTRHPLKDLNGNVISHGWKICSPTKSKGEYQSPGWQNVVGPFDDSGL
jgi:hypothetical protein